MPRGDEYFEEHIRARTVRPPKTLYKYTSVDTARIILKTGKIRFQSPMRYNDPFDSQWDPLWFMDTEEYSAKERDLLKRALVDRASWPPNMGSQMRELLEAVVNRIDALPESEREEARNKLLDESAPSSNSRDSIKNRMLDIRRRMRVLCLSATDRSILMWSHYADQHRGVLLGIDTEKCERITRRPFEKVRYSQNLPQLYDQDEWARNMMFHIRPQKEIDTNVLVLTKSQCWEYEQEWRFVWRELAGTTEDYYRDFDLHPNVLDELVFGCRTSDEAVKELAQLATDFQPKITLSSVSVHPGQFELVKQPLR